MSFNQVIISSKLSSSSSNSSSDSSNYFRNFKKTLKVFSKKNEILILDEKFKKKEVSILKKNATLQEIIVRSKLEKNKNLGKEFKKIYSTEFWGKKYHKEVI